MLFLQRNIFPFLGQSKFFVDIFGGHISDTILHYIFRLADIVHEFQNLVDLTSLIDREIFHN